MSGDITQPSSKALFTLGSQNAAAESCAVLGGHFIIELRRLFVPIFLHGGAAHIIFNLSFQLNMGCDWEREHGHLLFALLFFPAGVTGNLLSGAMGYTGVGASTSCYGLVGASMARTGLV